MKPNKKKKKLRFNKVSTVDIPFLPPVGMKEQLYKAGMSIFDKFELPKSTKSQTISMEIHWSKDDERNYAITRASIHKY